MKELKFRDLRPAEIDIRVGSTKKGASGEPEGFQLLLYKDARVDANILDETVGAFNWQKKFYQVKNTMICSLGINVNYDDPSKEPYWVWKDDAGDESETEAIKGEASDSFKRAAFAFSLGRALYSAPFIWLKVDENNHPKKSHYFVKEIEYKNSEISKLVICNEKSGEVVFSYPKGAKVSKTADLSGQNTNSMYQEEHAPLKDNDKLFLQAYVGNLSGDAYNNFFAWLKQKFGVEKITDLNAAQGVVVVETLKRRNK